MGALIIISSEKSKISRSAAIVREERENVDWIISAVHHSALALPQAPHLSSDETWSTISSRRISLRRKRTRVPRHKRRPSVNLPGSIWYAKIEQLTTLGLVFDSDWNRLNKKIFSGPCQCSEVDGQVCVCVSSRALMIICANLFEVPLGNKQM